MTKIPQELRDLRQWVSFHVETDAKGKTVKTPIVPGTSRLASPTDPDDWSNYETAAAHGYPAFALTKDDPYVFIDFDELKPRKGESAAQLEKRQNEAYEIWSGIEGTFVSYTETSVSGRGVHIIGRGVLHGQGTQRKDYGLELYDSGRFVIFTGDTILDAPITAFPADDLLQFERWMRKEEGEIIDEDPHSEERPETLTDQQVIDAVCKFDRMPGLLRMDPDAMAKYPSGSDADFDVIAELFRASRNTEQVKRIWRQLPLYHRKKKVEDYVERCTLRVKRERIRLAKEMARFTKQTAPPPPPPAPAQKPAPKPASKPALVDPPDEEPEPVEVAPDNGESFRRLVEDLPAGMLRDLTDAFLHHAHYPLFEGALVGGLNLVHLIFSRAYQTQTGLALKGWNILVGPTTSGKEIATKGPQEVLRATGVPSVFQMLRGEPRSEQGLFRMISENSRILVNMDECAAWIKTMCDPKAPACPSALREALTKLYSKGDESGVFFSTEKSEKGEKTFVTRPCLNIFGDSQAHNLYSGLTREQVLTGFLPRFLFIDIDIKGVSLHSQQAKVIPAVIVERVKAALIHTGVKDAQDEQPYRVPVDADVLKRHKSLELEIRKALFAEDTSENDPVFKMLHSRSAAKISIYAALLAVCENYRQPRVKMEHYEWAERFVLFCTNNTITHLTHGEFSSDPKEQRRAVETALHYAISMSEEDRLKNHYFSTQELVEASNAVPMSWLRNRVCRLTCFKNDRRDTGAALKSVLQEMQDDGEWVVISQEEAFKAYKARSPVIIQLTDAYWQGKAEEEG